MKAKVCFIIFSGFNERSVICLCRTLKKLGETFCIIALSKDDPCTKTDYSSHIAACRNNKSLELCDIDRCLKTAMSRVPADRYIIAPSSEFLNIFLLNNRSHFEDMGIVIPLTKKTTYKLLSDKMRFVDLCKSKNIPVPEEISLEENIPSFPLVAKPKSDITEDGLRITPEIIATREDLIRFRNTHEQSHYFYQRYIKGKSYYLLIYRYADGRVETFSQKNLLQQPNGKSIVLAMDSELHATETISPYLDILSCLQYRGLVMIEIKELDGRFYMIEANPRMWGPAQLMADAGNNLLICFINDYSGNNFPCQSTPQSHYYLWSGGIADTLESEKKLDSYAEYSEIDRVLQMASLRDIYGRPDTEKAFRSKMININSSQIRTII